MANTRQVGELGERIAEWFLRLKGYDILRRNYRFAGREIDLLARKGPRLIAVEVKLRRGGRYGAAVEAVDQRKLTRIRTALCGAVRDGHESLEPQIDVVVIDLPEALDEMTVRHIEAVC
ncbi:MAG: YraN family protein [Candidatus Krumholzibacteriia bacterium]